jgi:hypothetical protein
MCRKTRGHNSIYQSTTQFTLCVRDAMKFADGQKKVKLPDDLSTNSTVGLGRAGQSSGSIYR